MRVNSEKWEYGGLYKKYDMDGIIRVGTGEVKVHDIYEDIPDFMKKADCLFVDPPCSVGNLKCFYTKADRHDYRDKYEPFVDRLFTYIDEIQPKYVYIEVFASNRDLIMEKCRERFDSVHIDDSFYYHSRKNKCWIVRAGSEEAPHPDKIIDEEHYIRWICNNVDYGCIADPCMGRGLVGFYSNQAGKTFVGTELNKKRLAVLMDRIRPGKL